MNQDNKLIRSLLQNVKAGSNASFEQLYHIYSGRIFTLCFRLLGNANLAEELTKDIFITAWQQISTIRNDVPFASWIIGVSVYKSLDKLRNSEKYFNFEDEEKKKIDKKNYVLSDLENGLLTLPIKQRIVFVLNVLEKYSEEEICDLLLLNKEEIKNLLSEAQIKMNAFQNLIQKSDSVNSQFETFSTININKDIWKNIYSEINNVHLKNNDNELNNDSSFKDYNGIKNKLGKKEKKFGLFNWMKK